MNVRVSIAFAVTAGFGFGALSIHTLHAQGKPPGYAIVEIDVKNVDAYMKEYSPKAQALVKEKGGKQLAVGTGVTIEGAPAKRIAINQFDSLESAKAYFASKEFKEIRKIGDQYATFRVIAIEGRP